MNRRQFALGGMLLVMLTLCVLLAAAARSPQPSTSSLLTGLVAYWNMEESTGATRQDAGSNDLDLSDHNSVAQASGKIGYAAQFSSGGTNYLSHADNALLSPGNNDFTMALWVYLTTKPPAVWGQDSATIIGKWGSGNQREYNLIYRGVTVPEYGAVADTFEFAITDDGIDPTGATRIGTNNGSAIQTGQWYFVVAWHDSISDTLNIQLNNGTTASITHTTGIFNSTSAFELGRNEANLTEWLNALRMDGRVDEFGIWSRVLTDEERTELYNSGSGLTYPFDGSVPTETLTPTTTGSPTTTGTPTQTRTPTPTVTQTRTPTATATKARIFVPLAHGRPMPQWFTIKQDGFEVGFPGEWQVADYDNDNGHFYWAARDCEAASGTHSAWAVGGGDGAGLGCGSNYPDHTYAWMVYGPFSLAEATAAEMTLQVNLNTEPGWDAVCYAASPTNDQYYGSCLTGNSGGWLNRTLNLAALPNYGSVIGDSSVWIALIFDADSTINYPKGAFVDNVLLRQCKYGVCPASQAEAAPGGLLSEETVVLTRP